VLRKNIAGRRAKIFAKLDGRSLRCLDIRKLLGELLQKVNAGTSSQALSEQFELPGTGRAKRLVFAKQTQGRLRCHKKHRFQQNDGI